MSRKPQHSTRLTDLKFHQQAEIRNLAQAVLSASSEEEPEKRKALNRLCAALNFDSQVAIEWWKAVSTQKRPGL